MLADLAAATPPPATSGHGVVRVRPPARADLPAIEGLLQAAATARDRPPVLRREDLRLRWLLLEDPRDAVLVHLGDQLAAYASASIDPDEDGGGIAVHLDLQVHPARAGRGLGSWLLARATELGHHRSAGPVRLRTALTDGTERERAWFARRGFVARRHLLDLHLDLHAAPPAPRWPTDIRVRTFRPGTDDRVLWEVHQRAFADVATHLPIALDDLLRDRDPAADPELVLLAEHLDDRSGSEVVGVLIGRAGTEVAASDAWVRDLAVLPAWRRRGIAMALLRTGFAAFRTRGLTGVALEVDDVTLEGALALYRRAGMRITRRTDVLEWSS